MESPKPEHVREWTVPEFTRFVYDEANRCSHAFEFLNTAPEPGGNADRAWPGTSSAARGIVTRMGGNSTARFRARSA